MNRVVQLLKAHDYRQALVRLWVLGSSPARLNAWEQARDKDATFVQTESQFLADLQNEVAVSADRAQAAPLALIRALDDFVMANRALGQPALRRSNQTALTQEEGRGYCLVPVTLAARRKASLTRQAGNLSAWFHHHAVLPAETAHGLRVKLGYSQSAVDDALEGLWTQQQPALNVWIGHFNDAADVVWDRYASAAGNWRAQHVAPQAVRQASMLAAVAHAAKAGAHIIVFPEFTLDLAQRSALVRQLRDNAWPSLILVAAGSFHEPLDGATFNTAALYSAQGRTLLTYRKLRIFGGFESGAEHVDVGETLHVLVTPIGCITVLICKDFIDAHASVESLLTEVPVDWVLVPSFGDEKTIHAHKKRAKALALVKTGTNTVVAQTLNTAVPRSGPPKECVRGFGHVAGCVEPELQVGDAGGMVTFALVHQQVLPVLLKPSDPPAKPALKRVK